MNDEQILYQLVNKRSNLATADPAYRGANRRLPGAHLSLFSRFPLGTISPISGRDTPPWTFAEGDSGSDFMREILSTQFSRFLELTNTPTKVLMALAFAFVSARLDGDNIETYAKIPALSGTRETNKRIHSRLQSLSDLEG